jgi:uncharacterized repeat protein (TIGR03803 family)
MNNLRISSAINICAAAAILAGCGASQPPIGAPGAPPQVTVAQAAISSARHGGPRFLHSFGKRHDGRVPEAALLPVNGTLYGTTQAGGAHNAGTVFSINQSTGKELVLHSFGKPGDGASPLASLVVVNGTFYGTTFNGGAYKCAQSENICGTVFSIDSNGHEQVLHSFGSSSDGWRPADNLLNINGTLYGTTAYGGTHGAGTVFTINTSGGENVLHSFAGSKDDGCEPLSGLTDVNGTLYGTTSGCGAYGEGTVFSISTTGSEQLMHSFGYGTDGKSPAVGMINVSGTLYGTTGNSNSKGNGTVFSITTNGYERVVYNFDYTYGANPSALLDVNGVLYGTATGGSNDEGFIYDIAASGGEHLVYSFRGRRGEGNAPVAPLIDVNGTLLGTTAYGGRAGYGTVFELTPSK